MFELKIRAALLSVAHPVLAQLGKIGFPDREVDDEFMYFAQRKLLRGQVLLTRKNWEASNWLQAGYWKHAAMYMGMNRRGVPQVLEAVGKGVVLTSLPKFMLTKDHIQVYSPLFANEDQMNSAADFAMTLLGEPYDYHFKPGNVAWYCSEIPWWSYKQAIPDNPFTVRETLGVMTATPQDYDNAKKKWQLALNSKDFAYG